MKNLKYVFDEEVCASQWHSYNIRHRRMNITCICIAIATLCALITTTVLLCMNLTCEYALLATILCACALCVACKHDAKVTVATRVHELSEQYEIKEFQYTLEDGYMDLFVWVEDVTTGNVTRHRLPTPKYVYNSRVNVPTVDIAACQVLLPYPPEGGHHE